PGVVLMPSQKLLTLLLLCALCAPARAVILYSTATRNTSAPTGAYANSGWQYQGQFASFLGTAISKKFVITAGHVGDGTGFVYNYQGGRYRLQKMWDDPESDLRIYKVGGIMPTWARFFEGTGEVSRSVAVFGRGTQRGDEVRVNGALKGWKWGNNDGVQSWGRNTISGIADGGDGKGLLLAFNFDQQGNTYEAGLTKGDSGGGLFIKQGTIWRLAGINYSVDGSWSLTQNGQAFDANLFDKGGLWQVGGGFVNDTLNNQPAAAYATRINAHLGWISDVLNERIAPDRDITARTSAFVTGFGIELPEPGAATLLASVAGLMLRRSRPPERRAC
ncbi:MAG: hypothetical protein ACREJC_18445, partial [Tepidisphaeraceae bacterium]